MLLGVAGLMMAVRSGRLMPLVWCAVAIDFGGTVSVYRTTTEN